MKVPMNKLITIVTFAVIVLLIGTVTAQDVFQAGDGSFSTRKLTLNQEIGANNTLIIRAAANLPGKITLTASDSKEVNVIYYKKARAGKKEVAIDYIDLIAVVLDRTPEGSRLEMRSPNPAPWEGGSEWGLVEAEITVPKKSTVKIEASQFDVTATGPFKGLIIPSSLGKIEVTNVLEQLEISTLNRRVIVSDISGAVSISTSNAQLLAHNIAAIDKRARFENENGDIRIEGFSGEIDIENSYGRIYVSDFSVSGKGNNVRGMSGPILLEITEANDAHLRISNRFEDVEISLPEDISASLSLAVDEGSKIDVSDINVKPELIEHNRMKLIAGRGKSIITSSVRGSGNIYVRGSNE